MLQKKLIPNYDNKIFVPLLAILAFLINYRYGFIGMMPMDNTVLFNGGYRVLKGYIPFTDYWLVTGPLLDYINAFFFKLFGISWSTFIIHSSIINSLLALSSFFFFQKINLSKTFSFIYSLLISVLFYPVVGTPFVDHHSTFFVVLSFYGFILASKTNETNYFYFIPTFLILSFLSKQTPAAYGIIIISFLILIITLLDKKKGFETFKKSIVGSLFAIIFLILFFFLTKINFNDFYQQYISFGSSIGKSRINSYDFNLLNEIIKYKFISFFLAGLFFILIRLKIKGSLKLNDFFVIVASIFLTILLVFHQLLSLNQNFIFFLIPFLCGIIHTYYKHIFKLNYILVIFVLICFFAVSKYHLRFNEERKFNELENVDLSIAVDAQIIDKKLKGLKWITHLNPKNPQKEITNLIQAINIFKKDKNKKMLITEYQVISPIIDEYDNSPNQWHHPSVSFPLKGSKYYKYYQNYFISKIKKNNIKTIYEIREEGLIITALLLSDKCFKKQRVEKMLTKINLNFNCEELN